MEGTTQTLAEASAINHTGESVAKQVTPETASGDNFFSDENEAQSNWMKFLVVGDYIKGTLMSRDMKPARDDYEEQLTVELKVKQAYQSDGKKVDVAPEGEYVNVGFGISKVYVINRLRRMKIGQVVGFRFDNEQPAAKKGWRPAKSIKVYAGDMDPDHVSDIIKENFGGREVPNDEGSSPLDSIEM